jgi:ABC-type phosphate/phosphonate transport system substrate-binding protein
VIAVADKTVEVCANWWTADDDSNLTRMLTKGMLKNSDGSSMKREDFRIVLKWAPIINSPTAMLSSLPPDLKTKIREAFLNAATADNAAFDRLSDGKNQPWQPIDTAAYEDTIKWSRSSIGCGARRPDQPPCRTLSRLCLRSSVPCSWPLTIMQSPRGDSSSCLGL